MTGKHIYKRWWECGNQAVLASALFVNTPAKAVRFRFGRQNMAVVSGALTISLYRSSLTLIGNSSVVDILVSARNYIYFAQLSNYTHTKETEEMIRKVFSSKAFWSRAAQLTLAVLAVFTLQGQTWQAPIRGGSNFIYYQWVPGNSTATAETYAISNYAPGNPGYSIMNSQLSSMINNGQRSIRIPISFTSNTNLTMTDCTGSSGNWDIMLAVNSQLSPQCLSNLENLLTQVHNAGFQEVELGMWPQYGNNPTGWAAWDESTYQINWNLIVNLRTIAQQYLGGTPYFFDLNNELATAGPNGGVPLQYMQRLWGDYTSSFGKGDTFGFSIATSSDPNNTYAITQSLNTIYTYNGPPNIIELHAGVGNANTDAAILETYDQDLALAGISSSLVISESSYNNVNDAAGLATGAQSILSGPNHRQVWWLMQWPLGNPPDPQTVSGVDHPAAGLFLDFSAFLSYGW